MSLSPEILDSLAYRRLQREKTFMAATTVAAEITEEVPVPQKYEKYFCWKVRIPYKNTHLLLALTFPKMYPFRAPDIRVVEPVGILDGICMCHSRDGTLCVSGFLDDWSPTWTVQRVIARLVGLLDAASKADTKS